MNRAKRALSLAAAVALTLASPGPAHAYIRSTLSATDATPLQWDLDETLQALPSVVNGEVLFTVDSAGSSNIPGPDEGLAVERAFQHWEGVGTSRVAFARAADVAVQAANNDGINAIYWAEGAKTIIGGTQTNVTGFISMTPVFSVVSGTAKGTILDANIILNGRQNTWTLTPDTAPAAFDVEGIVTHEAGHFLGLDHSPVLASVMSPRYLPGEARQRILETDDMTGASAIYPEGAMADLGWIEGLVGRPAPVFGAMVSVLDAGGRIVQESISAANGSYTAPALTAGSYDVYVEPIDRTPPTSTNLFDETDLGGIYGATVDPNFLPSLPQTTTVVTPGANIRSFAVGSTGSTSNICKIGSRGTSLALVSFSNAPTFLIQGDTNVLIGVAGPNIDPGSVLEITGTGITSNGLIDTGSVDGEPYIIHSITVASTAALGTRSIRVTGPAGRTYASGAVRVYPTLSMSLGSPGLYFTVPGEVNNGRLAGQNPVVLSVRGNDVEMDWDDEPGAYGYHVYRGSLTSLLSGVYDHTQIPGSVNGQCGLTTSQTVLKGEALDPNPTYYLVSAYNNAGEGLIGRDSSNVVEPPPSSPCVLP